MVRGILYVETVPASPEQTDEYHRWHNEVHIPEVMGDNAFKSARRFEPVGHEGPFVTVYEIEAEDIEAVRRAIVERAKQGGSTRSPASAPPVSVRFYHEIAAYEPD